MIGLRAIVVPQLHIDGEKCIFTDLGKTMTISLPGSKKRGLAGLLGRKKTQPGKPAAQKQLDPAQVAKLFKKDVDAPQDLQPARLNAVEIQERDKLSTLRGALYSRKR